MAQAWRPRPRAVQEELDRLRTDPHVPAMRLSGWRDAYRIKLRKAGYRLGYRVFDDRVVIMVVLVDRRDDPDLYDRMGQRLKQLDEGS